jgi:predicted alpha-1,2-mannosidase
VAFLAARLGNQSIADLYDKRSKYYKNLFDTASGLFRGRNSLGQWRTPFEPLKATSPMNNPGDYTEANAWQYFWTPAQYDVPGMTELLGGKVAFEAKLDSFFAIPALQANKHLGQEAMIGQYAHGNEPSHHIAYLYGFTAHPAKGQIIVSEICRRFYNNTPDGMIGNDDCGQMSAWYIFATLGFYPVNPASGEYVIGQPQATDILINNGRQSIRITNNKTGMRINNKLITSATIRHQQLVP